MTNMKGIWCIGKKFLIKINGKPNLYKKLLGKVIN